MTTKTKKAELNKIAETLAKTKLGFTLKEQRSDREDFHELHVDTIRRLIEAAYEAGRDARR